MLSRRVVGIAGVLALAGCSYLKVDRAPKAVRRTDAFPGCTTEKMYPYVDVGLAVFSAISAGLIYAGSMRTSDEDDPTMQREMTTGERVVGGTFTLLQAGVFALSARWGLEQTARCHELQEKLASEPQPYPGQPYPGQPYPGQPYPGAPGQPYPAPQPQPYPAPPQPYPGQPYPAPPVAAPQQPYPAPPAAPQQKKPGGAS